MGGPIWSAPIHDQEWVASILASVKSIRDRYPAYDRISAVLSTISEVSSLQIAIFSSYNITAFVFQCLENDLLKPCNCPALKYRSNASMQQQMFSMLRHLILYLYLIADSEPVGVFYIHISL